MPDLTQKQQAEVQKEVEKQVQQQVQQEIKKEKARLSRTILNKSAKFGSEYRKQIVTALIAAFGLVIALSWQEVIKKFIANLPKSGILLYHPYLADLYTALVVTFIGVTAIMILSKWSQKTPSPQTK